MTYIIGKDAQTGATNQVDTESGGLRAVNYVWDTNALEWIKSTGGSTGTSVSVANFPATQVVSGTVNPPTYAKRYEQVSETVAYLGDAAVGSSESSSVWRIQKLTFTAEGNVTTQWANGSTSFNSAWSGRASLSYS